MDSGPWSAQGRGAAGRADDVVDDEAAEGDLQEEVTTEIIDGTAPEIDPVAIAQSERDEYLDALRRLQADFENYKKRVANQQADQAARAARSLVESLLPVLDTLDLAADHLGDAESPDARALVAASSLLRGVLAKEGLERIEPTGEEFDPNAHEAVGHLPAEDTPTPTHATGGEADDEDPASAEADATATATATATAATGELVVAQVMRPGYRWRGAVLRPAMVMVRG
ncbi:MAG TPA: nucleotide exchange factor GrpE [Acidimicrobiales bacterium]